MRYIATPKEISSTEILSNGFSLSPSQYKKVILPNPEYIFVKDFLSRELTFADLGNEVGSINYIRKSPYSFMRTKALQSHLYIPDITPESTIPVMPKAFSRKNLKKGDVIISKDSNIGEAVILDKDYPNIMLSGALYKLPIKQWKYYLLAFLKHDFFREQLNFMVPKSATIRHAKTIFCDCKIPLPQKNQDKVIEYVEVLTKSLVEKQKMIRQNHKQIYQLIENELLENQLPREFRYEFPSLEDLRMNNRIDAGFYSLELKKLIFPTINYSAGFLPLDEQGLQLKPGPSLEIKLLGTRIDSNIPRKGFYRLITPKQISNYGTAIYYEYIGTPRKIEALQYGDMLFGESGTGRTMMYLEEGIYTINNAHAHILRPIKGKCSLNKAITIRSILQYYKEKGITDHLTVGGSGGHLSPSYFNRVYIPNFSETKQKEIAELYHNPAIRISPELSLENFSTNDSIFNEQAGILELDKVEKKLKARLDEILDQIVNDIDVEIDFSFFNN